MVGRVLGRAVRQHVGLRAELVRQLVVRVVRAAARTGLAALRLTPFERHAVLPPHGRLLLLIVLRLLLLFLLLIVLLLLLLLLQRVMLLRQMMLLLLVLVLLVLVLLVLVLVLLVLLVLLLLLLLMVMLLLLMVMLLLLLLLLLMMLLLVMLLLLRLFRLVPDGRRHVHHAVMVAELVVVVLGGAHALEARRHAIHRLVICEHISTAKTVRYQTYFKARVISSSPD